MSASVDGIWRSYVPRPLNGFKPVFAFVPKRQGRKDLTVGVESDLLHMVFKKDGKEALGRLPFVSPYGYADQVNREKQIEHFRDLVLVPSDAVLVDHWLESQGHTYRIVDGVLHRKPKA